MILVIQGRLLHYRRPLLNALCKHDEVVVIHSGEFIRNSCDLYREITIPSRRVGPFYFQIQLLKLIKELAPTTVIAMFDLRWVMSVVAMYKFDKTLRWIWWGLDKGKSTAAYFVKIFIARRLNPVIFYSNDARDCISRKICAEDRFFVANNTFHIPNRVKCFLSPKKSRFLNVGSLDARKQNDVTIRAYANIYKQLGEKIKLTFIGDGPERNNLLNLVKSLGLDDYVEIVGEIKDPTLLARYYSEAIASVSFGQAGLAVLQSMGFGVPFITKFNAISGGEIFNIIDGVNGKLCRDSQSSLESVLVQLGSDKELARRMGEEAYLYYSSEASLENMVDNFLRAINFRSTK